MDDKIVIKVGILEHTLTKEEVAQTIQDLNFLQDVICALFDPKSDKGFDLPYNRDQYVLYLEEYLKEQKYGDELVTTVIGNAKRLTEEFLINETGD